MYINDIESLKGNIGSIDTPTEAKVKIQNPETEEWIETDRFKAIVNEELAKKEPDEDKQGFPWNITSSRYSIIDPGQAFQQLVEVLNDYDGEFEGNLRTKKNDGEIYLDLFLEKADTELDDGYVKLGFRVATNHLGSSSFWGTGYGVVEQDGDEIELVNLFDRKISVRHSGNAQKKAEFWNELMERTINNKNKLKAMFNRANDVAIDFSDKQYTEIEFMQHAGLKSDYLAEAAATNLAVKNILETEHTAWDLYLAGANALTNDARGDKDSQSRENYHNKIKKLVKTPEETISNVEESIEEARESEQAENMDEAADQFQSLSGHQ